MLRRLAHDRYIHALLLDFLETVKRYGFISTK